MTALLGLLVIALTVAAILRRAEVRLTLLVAALVLGCIAGNPQLIVRTFLKEFTNERFLLPIGTCMGFAYVLRHTGCDRHLVLVLLRPLQGVRFLLIPGVVVVAVLVNVPIISQSSTTVAVGAVLVPVLIAARLSATTISAALALGASIGGELLNPGAPELRTITSATGAVSVDCVVRVWPLLLIHLGVTVPLFWLLCIHAEGKATPEPDQPPVSDESAPITEAINPIKAIVPVVPLVLLFLTALPGPLRLFTVRPDWLGEEGLPADIRDGRLVGLAMLVGVGVAALTSPAKAGATALEFFKGAGYALAQVTSLIVVANCFGAGVRAVGLAGHLEGLIQMLPELLFPLASLLPLSFAWVSGSGMASTQSVYGFFVEPARLAGADPLRVGAVVSLSAAAGRSLSPVAPVVLLAASFTGANPLAMMRRLLLPLLAGLAAVVVVAMMLG
jgi:DcuC family C4-dicarboxylate transporter